MVIGLRAKATAIAVPSVIDPVRSAASTSGMNGSCCPSKLHAPAKPCASSCAASSPAFVHSLPISAPSIFIRPR